MEEASITLLLTEANEFRDEITYLREASKSKNCIVQILLEIHKVLQDATNSKTFNRITKIHTKLKVYAPEKVATNIMSPVTRIFQLLIALNYYWTVQKIPMKVTMFYLQNSSMSTITLIAILKARSSIQMVPTSISNVNRRTAAKHKRKRGKHKIDKNVTVIECDSMVKDVKGWEISGQN